MSLEKHQRIGINVLYHSSLNFSSLLELSFFKGSLFWGWLHAQGNERNVYEELFRSRV